MDDDWDLYAVVRSCKSSATASSMVRAKTTSSSSSSEEEGGSTSTITTLSCLASLTFEEENDPFSFPKLGEPRTNAFQELQQLFFKPACLFPNPPTTTTTPIATTTTTIATTTRNDNIIPDSAIVDHLRGSSGQDQYDHHHHHLPQQHQEQEYKNLGPRNGVVGPAQLISSPQSGFEGKFHVDQQQQEQTNNQQVVLPRQVHAPDGTLPLQMPLPPNLPTSQSPRSRKRKNQPKKQVCQVTAENLNSDLWAWRKYGQKPIKGSPYPRNYYRCSSSKGCAARKQVERSNVDPDHFIVTYTGDHSHPRPAHRNSLAGSTRAKTTTAATTTADAAVKSCSSPQSGTSLSPTTPHEEAASAVAAKRDKEMEMEMEMAEEKAGDGGEECLMEGDDEEDEENILIPNNNVMGGLSDEFFYGFQQLGYSPPGAAC